MLRARQPTQCVPLSASFRLDAGFGTRDNLALLIEMGYQVYSKPYSDWLLPRLKRQARQMTWTPVGKNAEMVAWKDYQPTDFPYPLDVGLERFYTGKTQRYGALLHFGPDPVTANLPGWFERYNARQTIEAGIKEGKQVFQMHHLKVRSAAAISLDEQGALLRFTDHSVYAGRSLVIPKGWGVQLALPFANRAVFEVLTT